MLDLDVIPPGAVLAARSTPCRDSPSRRSRCTAGSCPRIPIAASVAYVTRPPGWRSDTCWARRDGWSRAPATYWRLDVVRIDLPPLRDRPEDVPLLVERLLARTTERLGRPPRALAPAAIRALLEHDWPGNVRELEHALERAVALAGGAAIEIDDLPDGVRRGATVGDVAPLDPACPSPAGEPPALAFRDAKQQVVERFERAFITAALARHRGNVSRAAEETGMYRAHLQQKLAEYGIDADAFRRGTSR